MPSKPPATWPPRRGTDLTSAATRVAEIVAAAELAAEELRATAERRADDRIAEADRAAQMRVQAADEEADQVRGEASRFAQEERDKAAGAARELLAEARAAARDALNDGEQISSHLIQLGDALRTNAELLLRDIRAVHSELTARLDQADPAHWNGAGGSPSARPAAAAEPIELDVPEFIPRPPRR